jgi:transposase InsO family protein
MITRRQYQLLLKHHRANGGVVKHAAMKAGMDQRTAARYLKTQGDPKPKQKRSTRPDPLACGLWEAALGWLEPTPELDAKVLFEHLLGEQPHWSATAGAALRTFQRRVSQWRAMHGPEKEISFPQLREPGESMQFDWTRVKAHDFIVTIAGAPFEHMLAHAVLPYSNWEWAVPCRSESSLSLKRGVQEAIFELGGVPEALQTDHSSSATHQISRDGAARTFNDEYQTFCDHLRIEPRTIHVGQPDQNGDVEAANAHLKRRLKNHLILRGSNDFASEMEYAAFIAQVCRGANALRAKRLAEELPTLKSLPRRRYPETDEVTTRVSEASVIHVKKQPYSLPSRLIGAIVTVRIDERELQIYHGATLVRVVARTQEPQWRIDYRHLIGWLLKKPGAFARYVYRESLFPDIQFRQAYEALKRHDESRADKRYLKLLKLAAEGSETAVSEAIGECLRELAVPVPEQIEKRLAKAAPTTNAIIRALAPYDAAGELRRYSRLCRK